MNESFDDIRQSLAELENRYAADLANAETECLEVARIVDAQWKAAWRDPADGSRPAIESRLHRKFVMCFPLAAHAMNHVTTALATRATFPWVAKSSTRVAFEHALTAQWVLLTDEGEDRLKAGFDHSNHIRSERLIDGVRRLGDDDAQFAQAAHGLSSHQLDQLVQIKPVAAGPPTVEGMCQRFAGGGAENLLYDIHRELSGAVHPSLSSLRAHLRFASTGDITGIDGFGAGSTDVTFARDLALSAVWAWYSVEVCRFSQPRVAEVIALGAAAGLPVDLRNSDQQPDKQPSDTSAYWRS